MIRAAVLGTPIAHSLSPLLHSRAYEILGVEGDYSRIDLAEVEFPNFFNESLKDSWTGFSLTMPLKEVAFLPEFGISLDPRALKIHSVNTLIRAGNSYHGLSTDVLAFDRLLESTTFTRVAVIGAGGTARAALGALDGLVDRVDVLRRSESRDESLLGCVSATDLKMFNMECSLREYDLVISTTPAGVTDLLADSLTEANGTLIEALYKPWPTALSEKWQALGGNVKHGLDLLVEQALDQIQLMTGKSFDYAQMRATLLSDALEFVKE